MNSVKENFNRTPFLRKGVGGKGIIPLHGFSLAMFPHVILYEV